MSDSRPAPARLSPLNLLAEMTYPEYRNRHIFTARLRLFVFCGFFLLYVFGLSERYPLTHPALVAIGLGTLATVFCYYNIFTGRWMIPSFVLEVCADMVGISAAVALLGGLESNTYLLYFCYCLGGGLFYNYRVAAALASASLLSYFTLSWLALSGHLGPELMVTTWQFPIQHGMLAHPAWVHPALLTLLLFFAVYSVKMGQNFSQHREQVLEARNRELMALQRIGGMIRTTATLETVADRVVQALVEGLSFAGCLLMLVDRDRNALVCYPPSNLPALTEAESILQVALRDLTLPLGATENPVLQQVLQRKIVFRRNLADLLPGMIPHIPPERIAKLQARLGLQKSVILPLVAEGELLGALVGFTREGFVEERTVATLEASCCVSHCSLINSRRRTATSWRPIASRASFSPR
jgi:hypothetical protein